ncbi:MAG: hypothetical protein R3E96_16910 [Planctomycetota bacterium]
MFGRWYHAGPFELDGSEPYTATFGPEGPVDFEAKFAGDKIAWNYRAEFRDGVVNSLSDGRNVHFVAREIYCAAPDGDRGGPGLGRRFPAVPERSAGG